MQHKRNGMKRFLSILLACIMVAGLLPTVAFAGNVSGTIYASTLTENDTVTLTGDTELVMDTAKTLQSISGDYALTVSGAHRLTVNNQKGHAISVKSLSCTADLEILSAKDGLNVDQDITINNRMIDIGACGDGIYSRNGAIDIHCEDAKVDAFYADAISAKGDVALQGNYMLRTKYGGISNDDGDGIYSSNGNISLTEGTVGINAGRYGIYAKNGSFYMKDVILTVETKGDSAILSQGPAEIYSSDLYFYEVDNYYVRSHTGITMGLPWFSGILANSPDQLYWRKDGIIQEPKATHLQDGTWALYSSEINHVTRVMRVGMPGIFRLTGSNSELSVGDTLTFSAIAAPKGAYYLEAADHGWDYKTVHVIEPGESYVLTEADRGKSFRVKAERNSFIIFNGEFEKGINYRYSNEVCFDRNPFSVRLDGTTKYVGEPISVVFSEDLFPYDDLNIICNWQISTDGGTSSLLETVTGEAAPVLFPNNELAGKYVRAEVALYANYRGKEAQIQNTQYTNFCQILPSNLTGSVGIEGGSMVGDVLQALPSGFPEGAQISWQRRGGNNSTVWMRAVWVDISGASGSTYTAKPEDLECFIRAKVTAPGYHGIVYSKGHPINNKAELTGTVSYPSSALVGVTITPELSGTLGTIPAEYLHYSWEYGNGSSWVADNHGETRTFTPRAEHAGKQIRLAVTADGYSGTVYGPERTVAKQANTGSPVAPELSAFSPYFSVTVTNAQPGQEYVATESPDVPDWTGAKWSASGTVNLRCGRDRTIYVHTRMRETDEKLAGTARVVSHIFNGSLSVLTGVSVTSSGVRQATNGNWQLTDHPTAVSWKNDKAPNSSAWQEIWSPICTDYACTSPLTTVPEPVYSGYFVKLRLVNNTANSHAINFKTLKTEDCTLELPGWWTMCSYVTTGVNTNNRDQVEIVFYMVRNAPQGVAFTAQPEDGTAGKEESFTFSWALNETPTSLILQTYKNGVWQDGPSLLGKTSHTVTYDPNVTSYRLKATKVDLSSNLITYSRSIHIKWTDTYTLSGLSATAEDVEVTVVPFGGGTYCILKGTAATLAWEGGEEPGDAFLWRYFSPLYTDEDCTNDLTAVPTQGGDYYTYYYIARDPRGTQTADEFDFTQLSAANCRLTLAGYTAQCIGVTAGESNDGYENVRILFKLTKTSPDPILYPVWVGGVQVTDGNMDNVLGDSSGASVVYTPAANSAPARLELSNASITGATLPDNDSATAGIYSQGEDLEIVFYGINTVTGTDAGNSYGIFAPDAELNISGYGGLAVTAGNSSDGISIGIRADSVTVDIEYAGQLTATGGAGDFSAGVSTASGLTVNGGTLTSTGGSARASWGVVGDDIVLCGGTVEATGNTRAYGHDPYLGAYVEPYVTVSETTTAADAEEWNGTDYVGGEDSTYKYVKIEPDSVRFPQVVAEFEDGTVGEEYWCHIDAESGSYPYTYEVEGLPDGLSYDPAFHDIYGTPTTAGIYTITVTVTDRKGNTGTQSYSVTIAPVGGGYTVSFDSHGGTEIASVIVNIGEAATEPHPAPTKSGYAFGGWYANSACTQAFDFSEPIFDDMRLHALWLPKLVGLNVHVDGITKSGDIYKPNADLLEAVFHEDAASVVLNVLRVTQLYTNEELSEVLMQEPVGGTDYYFAVEMNTLDALSFDEAIRTGCSATAEDAILELVDLLRYPGGKSAMVVFKYTENVKHTVTYAIEGGSFGSGDQTSEQVYDGGKPANVPTGMTPDSTHKNTGSWYKGDTQLTGSPADETITGNVTFTYKFDSKTQHTVTYAVEGGSFAAGTELTEQVYDGGKPANVPTGMTPDSTHKNTGSWYKGSEQITGSPADETITGNVTFTYKFDSKTQHTVTYAIEGGSFGSGDQTSEQVYDGGKPVKVPTGMTPDSTHKNTGYWYKGDTQLTGSPADETITGNVTFTYKFDSKTQHTVTYAVEGGSFAAGTELTEQVYDGGKPANVPTGMTPDSTHKNTGSWYKGSEQLTGSPADEPITGNVTFTYKFDPKTQYTVTVNSGTADKAAAAADETVTLTADAAPSGKTFDKWVVNAGGVSLTDENASTTTFTMPAANVEVTATYKDLPPVTYTVTVNSGITDKPNAAAGETVTLTADAAPSGKTFDKWIVNAGGASLADENASTTTFTMPAAAVEVTATYKDLPPVTYTVTVNSGTADKAAAAAGETVTLTADAAPSGKTFDKWVVNAGGVSLADENASTTTFTMPAAAVEVTATYKDLPPVTYTVTFNPNGGSVTPTSGTTGTDGKLTSLPTPTRANYTFDGWFTTASGDDEVTTSTVFTADTTIYAQWTYNGGGSGGGGGGGGITTQYTLTYNTNGGSTVAATKHNSGTTVDLTATPTKAGFTFDGWYADAALTSKITSIVMNGDKTVYAGWKENGSVTPDHDCPSKHLKDVDENAWYHEYVDYVVEKGLMEGVADDLFAPNVTTSRAMIVTILHRLEGKPAASGKSSFDDVVAGSWYADAVAWAEENDIVNGYGGGKFGPNDLITREQFAAIMYRYANFKGYDTGKAADLSGYADATAISDWALAAMKWANVENLITGRTATTLVPRGDATRAEAAAILKRFIENVK